MKKEGNTEENIKDRDHKKLGKELGLFYIDQEIGKGLPMWLPKGATIRRELERFIVDEEIKRGYLHVYTPDLGKLELYQKSGHYPHYQDSMYAPIQVEDEKFMLRPMTCPHHFQMYLSEPHSYRELPMRIAELAKLYRYEQSGELMGLQRVRSMCLSDAHIICANEEQAVEEIGKALDLIEFVAGVFGLKHGEHYSFRLSLDYFKAFSIYMTGIFMLASETFSRRTWWSFPPFFWFFVILSFSHLTHRRYTLFHLSAVLQLLSLLLQ